MSTVPREFTREFVTATADDAVGRYLGFLKSREPMASILASNPWLRAPRPGEPLEWGKGWYYDTTVGRKHDYWKDVELPQGTKDINQLRYDLYKWGYCLIEDGLSEKQCEHMRRRLEEQAEAERIAGISYELPSIQMVWTLINKGECFVKCIEHDPDAVQAGPVIEQIMDETLGRGWYCYSFVAAIAFPGCQPQGLHQDQAAIHPFQPVEAPVLIQTMYIMQDVDEVNGGTLVIPGSHRLLSEIGSGTALPPAINIEASAGAVMLFDGRLLHGTGVNRSNRWRYVASQPNVKPWLRQQENLMLAVKPEVLEKASPKLLQRIGLQAAAGYGITEGYGAMGSGRPGDPNSSLVHVRRAVDHGRYRRVGELTPDAARTLAPDSYTLQELQGDLGEKRRGRSDPRQNGPTRSDSDPSRCSDL